MVKVTIANYLIGNLSNRFPITQVGIVDTDIIDVMVDGWQHNRYPILTLNVQEEVRNRPHKRLLM